MVSLKILTIMDELLNVTGSTSPDLDAGHCPQLLQHFEKVYPVEHWKAVGFFQDPDLLDIDCHWMTFEPLEPFVHYTLSIIGVIIFLVGFVSNVLVICTIFR